MTTIGVRSSLAVTCAAILVSSAAAAQRPPAPAALSAVPVYPGAEPYDPESKPMVSSIRETLLELPDGIPLLSSTTKYFLADVAVDKVAAFYRGRLGGIASGFKQWKAVDPRTLSPGKATAVHYMSYSDGWTTRYVYHWYRKEGNGDIVLNEVAFSVLVTTDPRLVNRKGPDSIIMVTEKTFSQSATALAPDEKALGVPVYPGAIYDSNASTSTLGALFTHVFRTGDPVERVTAFYERACGRKALPGAPQNGGTNWYLRPCSDALPDDYIVLEQASDATEAARTMIIYHLTRIPPDRD